MTRFRARGFVSLLSTFTFIISLVSGIVLYFPPQGKVAHWINWTFWGLDKETWGALHINSSLILFIVIIFHFYLNWNILINYIKKRAQAAINLKVELAISLLFSLFIIIASIYSVQPFKQIIDWNEGVKDYWAAKTEAQPPVPHAEEMTVEEFCEELEIPVEKFENRMKKNNWAFERSQTIKEIAQANDIAPADIYNEPQVKSEQGAGAGAGWGRMTVPEVCEKNNIRVEVALAELKKLGVNPEESQTIRDISSELKMRPYEVIKIITGETFEH